MLMKKKLKHLSESKEKTATAIKLYEEERTRLENLIK